MSTQLNSTNQNHHECRQMLTLSSSPQYTSAQLLNMTKYDREVTARLENSRGLNWFANWIYYKVWGGHAGVTGGDTLKKERASIDKINSTLNDLVTLLAIAKIKPQKSYDLPHHEKADMRIVRKTADYLMALGGRIKFCDKDDQAAIFRAAIDEIGKRINAYNNENFKNEGYNVFGNYITNDNFISPKWKDTLANYIRESID